MLDRLQEASAQELERALARRVKHLFEVALQSGAREVPVIGGPLAPPKEQTEQMRLVVQALLARKWFEHEAPPWAQPLPLGVAECNDLFNGVNRGNRRCWLRGGYGIHLWWLNWETKYAQPFELFCAEQLGG